MSLLSKDSVVGIRSGMEKRLVLFQDSRALPHAVL